MTKFTRIVTSAAAGIAAFASIAASAHAATTLLVSSGWQADTAPARNAPTVNSPVTFVVPVGGPDEIFSLTDCCVAGDTYSVKINGFVTVFTTFTTYPTPFVNNFGPAASYAAPDWLNNSYAHLQLDFAPGNYSLVIKDTSQCCGYPAGLAYRLDIPTPEPATWALMMVGVGGIGFALRRKASKTALQAA